MYDTDRRRVLSMDEFFIPTTNNAPPPLSMHSENSSRRTPTTKYSKQPKTKKEYIDGMKLRKMLGNELKAYDSSFSMTIATTANSKTINPVQNGSEIYNRVGRKIYMKSLHIRGWVNNKATAVTDYARIMIVYDYNNDGSVTTTFGEILANIRSGGGSDWLSNLDLDNRSTIKIIRDYEITLPAVTNTAGAGVLTNIQSVNDPIKHSFNINWYIDLNGLETVFNSGTSSSAGDIQSGALFIKVFSGATDFCWEIDGTYRLRFYD